MRIAIALMLVLVSLIFTPVNVSFAQDADEAEVDASEIICMPEGAPDGQTEATLTLLRGDESVQNLYVHYRLSSVIRSDGICAVSGWMVSSNYQSQSIDFAQAAQFQYLETEEEIVLNISNTHLLALFGLQANQQGGIAFVMERAEDGFLQISQIHTSLAQLNVMEPAVTLRFDAVGE